MRPLALCLQHQDFELAFLLLTKGADPRVISLTEGDTPLHAALHIFLDVNGRPLFQTSFCLGEEAGYSNRCSGFFPVGQASDLEKALLWQGLPVA